MVNEDFGHPDGAIIFDESGFMKKGDDSIGVGQQYCGTIGKVKNCQVGVFAAYRLAMLNFWETNQDILNPDQSI